jgi:hypothetical protein
MKKLVMLAVILITAQSACAKSLNGNVDATFTTENGGVFLTLVNKHLSTPVTVTEVDLLLPQKNKKEAQKMSLFSGSTAINANTKIPLGNVERMVSLLYPSSTQDQIKAASPIISDDRSPTCSNCQQDENEVEFRLSLVYSSGASQSIFTGSDLHLKVPFNIKTAVIFAPRD